MSNPYLNSFLPRPPLPNAAVSYTHEQSSPSATWTVNHNLGFKPNVELYTVGGNEFEADVLHTSNNQFIVYLVTPIAGYARAV